MLKYQTTLIALACCAFSATAHAGPLKIEFDYSLDTDGFFDASTAAGLERRATLELAAAYYRFLDRLAPIQPVGEASWSATVFHPSTFQSVVVTDRAVAADTVVVYVGGRQIPVAGVLGFANSVRSVTATGPAEFIDAVHTRGQIGAAVPLPHDFGVAMGSITFFHSSEFEWHFGATTAGLDSTKSDFLTTAIHEIGHLLGMGEAASWFRWVEETESGVFFHGPAAMAAYGGPVPLDQYGSHFASGIQSTVDGVPQSLLMDSSTPRGVREVPTHLDLAAFQDIGWILVPEPESWILAAAALAFLWLALPKPRR